MDTLALAVANTLVGNAPGEAALEMHFPGPVLRFESGARFALAGAGVEARLDEVVIPPNAAMRAWPGATLSFSAAKRGARVYLAVSGGFAVDPWLGSCSTNLAAAAGGWKGRALQRGDVLPFKKTAEFHERQAIKEPSCTANLASLYPDDPTIRFCPGAEFDCLTGESKKQIENASWKIAPQSNRMGYRTEGPALALNEPLQLVSSAVVPGTIQLLPGGQFIILMADCQTTGGYPRIGHVVYADLSRLAQRRAGEPFRLKQVTLEAAYTARREQERWLRRLRLGVQFRSH
mgnify:CR=1 FL=1